MNKYPVNGHGNIDSATKVAIDDDIGCVLHLSLINRDIKLFEFCI